MLWSHTVYDNRLCDNFSVLLREIRPHMLFLTVSFLIVDQKSSVKTWVWLRVSVYWTSYRRRVWVWSRVSLHQRPKPQLLLVASTVSEVADYLKMKVNALCPFQAGCYERHQNHSPGYPESQRQRNLVGRYFSHCHIFILRWTVNPSSYNDANVRTVMTSWSTCWSRSQRRSLVCQNRASPSTCPPSSSMALSSSTTDSVPSSWVRSYQQTIYLLHYVTGSQPFSWWDPFS